VDLRVSERGSHRARSERPRPAQLADGTRRPDPGIVIPEPLTVKRREKEDGPNRGGGGECH